ncbi:MAG: AMP-binding protein [Candidatus Sumerlaeaceae bacterium]|nr:AMP-binding protein [Candidatus Sumerlaeaceae bacterium]
MVVDVNALAARYGGRICIQHPAGIVAYADLPQKVASRAAAFRDAGVSARVVLPCVSDTETLVSALALLELGCTIIPISADSPEAELGSLAQNCAARWIVRCSTATAVTGDVPTASTPEAALGLLSSGSTGRPKLVLRSTDHVRAAMDVYIRSVALAAEDKVMAVVPLEHSYGFANVFLSSLQQGATIVFPGTAHPRAVVEAARRDGVTLFPGAPLFFDLMAKFAKPGDAGLPGVRACISVGTALATRIHAAFTAAFNVPLWQSYGASEAGPVCVNKTGEPDGEMLALGEPCDGVEIQILGEDGNPVPDGAEGEIVVVSPAVGIGYDGPTDGASRIEPGRFYTGDIGCMRNGTLFFRGRRKLLVAAAGNKVDPQEVENVLLLHPKIADAAVVPHREEDGREFVKAIVVLREPAEVVEISEFCASRLAAFKIPRVFEFRDSLPRNTLGKLQREKL